MDHTLFAVDFSTKCIVIRLFSVPDGRDEDMGFGVSSIYVVFLGALPGLSMRVIKTE